MLLLEHEHPDRKAGEASHGEARARFAVAEQLGPPTTGATMRLSVPTNWDLALIDGLAHLPVGELFGSLPHSPVGSGRPRMVLPQVSQEQAREHIEAARAKGIAFNYVLNAPCMGNTEFDKTTHRALLDYLAWVEGLGVAAVTVTIPYLLRIIKRQFPRLKVKASVIAQVNSLQMARQLQDLGADEINVDYMLNRDLRRLGALRRSISCQLSLLVNDICLYHCPYRQYHYNLIGHSTQTADPSQGTYLDFCMISCVIEKLTRPEELIRARWIRPEDLQRYENLGFDRFKLSGRNMPTGWIIRAARAYADRTYAGNLGDILIPEPNGQVHYRIDNQQLDGFLDHFAASDCAATDCASCGYCRRFAERAVTIPDPRTKQYVRSYQHLLDSLVNSEPFEL
jgi:collagenase-like PrtC family protease